MIVYIIQELSPISQTGSFEKDFLFFFLFFYRRCHL